MNNTFDNLYSNYENFFDNLARNAISRQQNKINLFNLNYQNSFKKNICFFTPLTDTYLFEICLTTEYNRLVNLLLKKSFSEHSEIPLNKLKAKMIYQTLRSAFTMDKMKVNPIIKNEVFRPPLVYDQIINKSYKENPNFPLVETMVKLWTDDLNKKTETFSDQLDLFFETCIENKINQKEITSFKNTAEFQFFITCVDKITAMWEISPLTRVGIILFLLHYLTLDFKIKNLLQAWILDYEINKIFINLPNLISVYSLHHATDNFNKCYANVINFNYDVTFYIYYVIGLLSVSLHSLNHYLANTLSCYDETNLAQAFNAKSRDNYEKYWPQLSKKQINFLVIAANESKMYLIPDFMKLTNSCYETARSSLEGLYKLNLLTRTKEKRKFFYSLRK